ncbi:hypothetical protein Tco_0514914 [Tanacetum coccineum]
MGGGVSVGVGVGVVGVEGWIGVGDGGCGGGVECGVVGGCMCVGDGGGLLWVGGVWGEQTSSLHAVSNRSKLERSCVIGISSAPRSN